MREERNKLKKELLSKEKPGPKDLESSQFIYIARNERACSEKTTKGVVKQRVDKEISMDLIF